MIKIIWKVPAPDRPVCVSVSVNRCGRALFIVCCDCIILNDDVIHGHAHTVSPGRLQKLTARGKSPEITKRHSFMRLCANTFTHMTHKNQHKVVNVCIPSSVFACEYRIPSVQHKPLFCSSILKTKLHLYFLANSVVLKRTSFGGLGLVMLLVSTRALLDMTNKSRRHDSTLPKRGTFTSWHV